MDLSLDEKISLVTGDGMWRTKAIPGKLESIFMADGPHGIRKEVAGTTYAESEKATCFPTASCVASSWDIYLIGQMARGIAREAIEKDVSLVLGPGVNIKRTPVCGRNFEYFSEDPYLSGKLAASYIKNMQDMGVGTSLKHFAGNNQEANRQTANSQIDERALREIYLRAFEIAVKEADPASVMCSYNRLNGAYLSENNYLLSQILRGEWSYQGAVISDWGACIDLAKSLEAGLDLEMPDSLGIHANKLRKAIKNNSFDHKALDRASSNVINLVEKYGKIKQTSLIEQVDNHELARKIASQSAVLLKNEGLLPLDKSKDKNLLVIGALAEEMRFQGGGSSRINPKKTMSFLHAIKNEGFEIKYAKGYQIDSEEIDKDLHHQALEMAKSADKILFFGGLTDIIEGEGFDRPDLNMPKNQEYLIRELVKRHKDVVYVSFSGAPYKVDFVDGVKAFIQMYLAGEAVSEALVDILVGRVNPSGKLAETWPKDLSDVLSHDYYSDKTKDLEYRESLFVGYRYFDSYDIESRFDFGQGLSYTTFAYDDLKLDFNVSKRNYSVSLSITNTGSYDGSEVVQVYIKNPKEFIIRAKKELRGFAKVFLKAGEKKTITIKLDENSFAFYDVKSKSFVDKAGIYEVEVGASIKDIRLCEKIRVLAQRLDRVEKAALGEFFVSHKPQISEETFSYLYQKELSNFDKIWRGQYSLYNSLDDMVKVSWTARLVRKIIVSQVKSMYKKSSPTQQKMMIKGATSGPFDSVICQSNMPFLHNVGLFLVDICNKKRLKAIRHLVFGG